MQHPTLNVMLYPNLAVTNSTQPLMMDQHGLPIVTSMCDTCGLTWSNIFKFTLIILLRIPFLDQLMLCPKPIGQHPGCPSWYPYMPLWVLLVLSTSPYLLPSH